MNGIFLETLAMAEYTGRTRNHWWGNKNQSQTAKYQLDICISAGPDFKLSLELIRKLRFANRASNDSHQLELEEVPICWSSTLERHLMYRKRVKWERSFRENQQTRHLSHQDCHELLRLYFIVKLRARLPVAWFCIIYWYVICTIYESYCKVMYIKSDK